MRSFAYFRVRHNAMTDLKLSEDINEFLNRRTTVEFLRSAKKLVALLETGNLEKSEFLQMSHAALIDLYATGHAFEVIPLKYSSADSEFDRDQLFEKNNSKKVPDLEEQGFYWEIFDPTYAETDGQPGLGWKITDKEASQGWLVDDFADIYRDLKIELKKIDMISTDESIEDALWQLKWSFFHHWGNHCINAIRYLHYYCYEGKNMI